MLNTIPVQKAEAAKAGCSGLIVADGQRPEIRSLLAGASYPILWLMQGEALSTVSQHLALRRQIGKPVRALHWVSHGSPGVLQVGDTSITEDDLQTNQSMLKTWGVDCLSFWSCNYAADPTIISVWSGLTDALVFAAKQPLGQLEDGQLSWELSSRDHNKQDDIPFALAVRESWPHQLGTGQSQSLGIPADSFLSVEFEDFRVKKLATTKSGKWTHKLIVSGDEQNTIWFQDRPLRNYGHFEFDAITGKKAWYDLFQADNPNTLLSGQGRSFVFENGPFKRKGGGKYAARIRQTGTEKDPITGKWQDSSLLIDPTSDLDIQGTNSISDVANLFGVTMAGHMIIRLLYRRIASGLAKKGETSLEDEWSSTLAEGESEGFFDSSESFIQAFAGDSGIEGVSSVVADWNESALSFMRASSDYFMSSFEGSSADSVAAIQAELDEAQTELFSDISSIEDISESYADSFQVDIDAIFEGSARAIWGNFSEAISESGVGAEEMESVSNYLGTDAFQNTFSTAISNAAQGVFDTETSLDTLGEISSALDASASSDGVVAALTETMGGETILDVLGDVLLIAAAL